MVDVPADPQNDIVRLIREKQAMIARLQAELDEARALLAGPARPSAPKVSAAVFSASGAASTDFAARLTTIEMAVEVLKTLGTPQHVNAIIAGIAQRYNAAVQYSTLVGNLARLHKSRKLIHRFGRNTFGLIEWAEREDAPKVLAGGEVA